MKKITYLFLLLFAISACKYDEKPYSFTREFDSGTYITPDGKVKFISGKKDSLIIATDNYAIIQENISYVKKSEGSNVLNDSILIYGHVYSLEPNPEVLVYDYGNPNSVINETDLFIALKDHCDYSGEPEAFITDAKLHSGAVFESSFGLQYEEEYYVRSFVITGYFDGNTPKYKDIAYNQQELKFSTDKPNDLWVGGDMLLAPKDFPSTEYWGATSFSYDGYMFVAQGHNAGGYGEYIRIYRYDHDNEVWDEPYKTNFIGNEANFTNAVSFVIEDVPLGNETFHDCVFIGIGRKGTETDPKANTDFYRLDLEEDITNAAGAGDWVKITGGIGQGLSIVTENAVAFSINGIGYVGLGSTVGSNSTAVNIFTKFDPSDRGDGHYYGKWTIIGNYANATNDNDKTRTGAVCFQIGNEVYIAGGKDKNGVYHNDLWKCRQTLTDKKLIWEQKTSFPADMLAREDAVGFALGEMGYVGLGKNNSGEALGDFWRYNPFTNQWDRRRDFGKIDEVIVGKPRYEAIGVGVKISDDEYRGYIGTGWAGLTGTDYNDFWHYRP